MIAVYIADLQVLNSKETKRIMTQLGDYYGATLDKNKFTFLITRKGRLYIVNNDITAIPFDTLRIKHIGIYFAEIRTDGIRLSIEGSNIIGPQATGNIIDLLPKERDQYMRGNDLENPKFAVYDNSFVILRCLNDYLGSGKVRGDRLYNYFPKSRRLP